MKKRIGARLCCYRGVLGTVGRANQGVETESSTLPTLTNAFPQRPAPYLDSLGPTIDPSLRKWVERVDKKLFKEWETEGIADRTEFRIARATALKEGGHSIISLISSLVPAVAFFILAFTGALEWGPSVAAGLVAALFPLVATWLVYFGDRTDPVAAAIIAHRAARDD